MKNLRLFGILVLLTAVCALLFAEDLRLHGHLDRVQRDVAALREDQGFYAEALAANTTRSLDADRRVAALEAWRPKVETAFTLVQDAINNRRPSVVLADAPAAPASDACLRQLRAAVNEIAVNGRTTSTLPACPR